MGPPGESLSLSLKTPLRHPFEGEDNCLSPLETKVEYSHFLPTFFPGRPVFPHPPPVGYKWTLLFLYPKFPPSSPGLGPGLKVMTRCGLIAEQSSVSAPPPQAPLSPLPHSCSPAGGHSTLLSHLHLYAQATHLSMLFPDVTPPTQAAHPHLGP